MDPAPWRLRSVSWGICVFKTYAPPQKKRHTQVGPVTYPVFWKGSYARGPDITSAINCGSEQLN